MQLDVISKAVDAVKWYMHRDEETTVPSGFGTNAFQDERPINRRIFTR